MKNKSKITTYVLGGILLIFSVDSLYDYFDIKAQYPNQNQTSPRVDTLHRDTIIYK